MNAFLSRISPRIWALGLLLIWGGIYLWLPLLHFNAVGLDEGAARALLLNWSISEQVASPVVVLGVPDFRALLFVPLGVYWAGSLLAAKVYTLLVTFGAAMMLFKWAASLCDRESAMIATGLFLIAPLTLTQIDAVAVAPYLLLVFGVAAWVENRYQNAERALNSWFYVRLLLIAIAVTLHPAGLAYPVALTLNWLRNPTGNKRQQRQNLAAFGITLLFILALQAGWVHIEWFANPVTVLGQITQSTNISGVPTWSAGLLPLILAVAVLWLQRDRILNDFMSTMLGVATLLGALAADAAWALLVLCLILYLGTPALIRANEKIPGGFVGKRGLVLVAVIVIASVFMRADKTYAHIVANNILPPQAELIQEAALEAEATGKDTRIISQWPAKTIIACRCDALPLPPLAENADALYEMIKPATMLVFDPQDPDNAQLSRQVAELSGRLRTTWIGQGGVVVKIPKDEEKASSGAAQRDMQEGTPAPSGEAR